jgi:thymidylate synthase ThyX
MGYECEILVDSVADHGGRLTTFRLRFPRFVLAQITRHRALSFSVRSNRAVPVERIIAEVESDPVIPIEWGRNRRGMQATETLGESDAHEAEWCWKVALVVAVDQARKLSKLGAHKQIVNRLLEPFSWSDAVVSGTEWANFFSLRVHDDAQPEMRQLAVLMARAFRESVPSSLDDDEWHLPYVVESGHGVPGGKVPADCKLSAARCARVSYRPHDAETADPEADVKLHDRLVADGHVSPLEHQGVPSRDRNFRSGNFIGWHQYRQMVPGNVRREFNFSILDRFEESRP